MKKDLYYSWFMNHLMFVTNKDVPIEALDVLVQFSEENLHSDLIKQDVLILTGRNDHMVPFKMHESKKGLIVDTRSAKLFKDGHLQDSINVQAASEDNPFETWLGSIVEPKEEFHLVIDEPATLGSVLDRVAKIGYEAQLISVITLEKKDLVKSKELNLQHFKEQPDDYTIVDVRNKSEVNEGKIFESALSHPLNKLRDTAAKIPTNKPVVVHCSSGYRSAAASSILLKRIKDVEVYDLGDAVEGFQD